MTRFIAALTFVATIVVAAPASAQRADSGTVHLTVEESMGMGGAFRVQAAGRTTLTNAQNAAHLTLPVGPQVITVTRIGFKPATVSVVVIRDSMVAARVAVEMGAMEMSDVRISATRIEKLSGDTPIRVEVVDDMEVDEKTLMSPSGIGMLLNETPGLRVQAASPGLGTGSVRILGLPGQYTVMLADGLPLYGGSASAIGPLDVSPVDLQRMEVIKGAASALYGGQSLGGVINLVSKAPNGQKELLINRRTLGVTDAATWISHRIGKETGVSLLAAGTTQGAEDIDGDGWADQARATRWSLRPRLNFVDERGRSVFVTAGYGVDDRDGGTQGAARLANGLPFREALSSRRADVGATASVPTGGGGNFAARFAYSTNSRQRTFGPGQREDDRASTGFLEVTRTYASLRNTTVVGGAVQADGFANALNRSFDHDWVTPGLFVTTEQSIGSFTLSASVRGDAHPEAGMQLTERVALLAKPIDGWSVRASVGTGFAAPAATTEETEATGLRFIVPGRKLGPEKSVGGMLDVQGPVAGADLLMTVYTSAIGDAIQLADTMAAGGSATLRNAATLTHIGGVEASALWQLDGSKLIASYGYSRGSRPNPATGLREEMPMIPRHHLGLDFMFAKPGVYRGGLEGTWYAEQSLDDNPYRTKSKPYLYVMALIARQFGPVEAVANFENLLNVRQTSTDPLVRPTPGMAGRWTTGVWAPLEGFMANVAVRYRWK